MLIRNDKEKMEQVMLSEYASLSGKSKGRLIEESKCDLRTEYERDRDRILHSKAFRRLKHKTQVFIAPEGDHFRTRLTHTLEVSQISRTIASILGLNKDLVEAIALGHDLGHTPFGHTGEKVLDMLNENGFNHNEQSLRVVDFLENRNGKEGLNLTYEVREGIINHSGNTNSVTLEGQVVRLADRIAYINHDIDDAIRAKIISKEMIPRDFIEVLGDTHSKRIDTMVRDICLNSDGKDRIYMSDFIKEKMDKLRLFMFENVYFSSVAKSEEKKVEYLIVEIYNYYYKNYDRLPPEYRLRYLDKECTKENRICDYIAGMTDRYAISIYKDIFIPKAWNRY